MRGGRSGAASEPLHYASLRSTPGSLRGKEGLGRHSRSRARFLIDLLRGVSVVLGVYVTFCLHFHAPVFVLPLDHLFVEETHTA